MSFWLRLVEQEEEAAKEALATEFDYIQARLNAQSILAKRINKKKRSNILLRLEQKDERAVKKRMSKQLIKRKKRRLNSAMMKLKRKKGSKKRRLGTRGSLKAKEDTSDEDKVIDVEILDHQYPIVEWKSFYFTTKPQHDPTKPLEDVYLNMQLEEFEDSDDDDLAKSDHEEAERV
ncbi:hypothetical protein Tco_0952406 [Tanacetum coccineum]|uniref:Uncharacterized protein n=1 Tax=Tanacetum coccineum TaxID=301880 RepID=A0ABQ5DWV3_9ASTR